MIKSFPPDMTASYSVCNFIHVSPNSTYFLSAQSSYVACGVLCLTLTSLTAPAKNNREGAGVWI